MSDAQPVFIVGFPRSGTTAMSKALSTDPGFFGDRHEGHYLYYFRQALERLGSGRANPAALVAPPENRVLLESIMADAIDRFVRTVYNREDGRWVDKTPESPQIKTLPVLQRLFPAARFIFLYRGVVEAVRSNIAKWPNTRHDQIGLAQRWVGCQQDWRRVRELLGAESWMEIDQRVMLTDPAQYTSRLAELLGIDHERADRIMQYLRDHKRVNAPVSSGDAETYYAVRLTDEEEASILAVAGDEDRLWPFMGSDALHPAD